MRAIAWLVLGLLLLALASRALAEVEAYGLLSWTVDSGGGRSEGASYLLSGSLGQPDAGSLSGGVYTLAGGFWGGGMLAPPSLKLYLPLTSK